MCNHALAFLVNVHITLDFICFQVEVLEGGGNCGNGGQFVVREVQLHQAGVVKGLWVDATALQATPTETQILQTEQVHKSLLTQTRERVVRQIELLY